MRGPRKGFVSITPRRACVSSSPHGVLDLNSRAVVNDQINALIVSDRHKDAMTAREKVSYCIVFGDLAVSRRGYRKHSRRIPASKDDRNTPAGMGRFLEASPGFYPKN